MPIKELKKLLWAANGVFVVVLAVSVFFLFFGGTKKSEASQLPELPPATPKKNNLPENYGMYSEVWQVKLGPPPPPPPPEEKIPDLLVRLRRYINIITVVSKQQALLEVNNEQKIVSLNESIEAGSLTVKPTEMVMGKGVRFQETGSQAEAFLEVESKDSFSNNVTKQKMTPHKIGENSWYVPPQEGKNLFENYDKYVQELGLKPYSNSQGEVIGIHVRQIPEQSKASFYGFETDDIVTSINGVQLDRVSPELIKKIAKQSSDKQSVVIRVLRSGRAVELRYQTR